MISARFAPAACVVVALALVPTIIHSYAGLVVDDGLATTRIPRELAGFTSSPSNRDAGWGRRRFESHDWFERQYVSGGDEVRLTVLRSYDLKRLYHHPELDVAYGAGYLSEEIVSLPEAPTVPVRLLQTVPVGGGSAMYALHYDGGFVRDPLWLQARVAGQLLFTGRKPMTLIFARNIRGAKGASESYPSARVLVAALRAFVADSGSTQR